MVIQDFRLRRTVQVASAWWEEAAQGEGPAWRKSFWKSALGSMFHAMVSVMAVKIQLSSPRGVLRSVCLPGMRSMSSLLRPSCRSRLREQNQRSATCHCTDQRGPPLTRTSNGTGFTHALVYLQKVALRLCLARRDAHADSQPASQIYNQAGS